MPGKSITTDLLLIKNYALQAFAPGFQVNVLYTDFSKVYDKVDLIALNPKLFNLGIRYPYHSWLVSFITGRQQYVKNFKSSLFNINSGVSRGSPLHLAPLLLLNLFLNNIEFINSEMLLYAADMKIHRIITSPRDNLLLREELVLGVV